MRAKRNLQVYAKKRSQVLRRKPSKKSTQHLSAKKTAKNATVRKHLPPSDLDRLINDVNQVPEGLPSLRELRRLARGNDDELDRLVFQEIARLPLPLQERMPALPDVSNAALRMLWKSGHATRWGRGQLYYCYDYLLEGRLALGLIADTDQEYIGPFHFEIHLDVDSDGRLKVHPHPILEMLQGVERKRILRCPICNKIYWAERSDQPACTKRCNNVRRSRIQRGTFPRPDKS